MRVSCCELAREWSEFERLLHGPRLLAQELALVVMSARAQTRGDTIEDGSVRLARVIRTAPTASTVTTAALIEIEGARVAVSSGANAETLRVVFDALRFRASAP